MELAAILSNGPITHERVFEISNSALKKINKKHPCLHDVMNDISHWSPGVARRINYIIKTVNCRVPLSVELIATGEAESRASEALSHVQLIKSTNKTLIELKLNAGMMSYGGD
jgi:hypothetical protein